MQYSRNDSFDFFTRNTFRVRGDVLEITPAYEFDKAFRIELFGDEIERISEVNTLTGEVLPYRKHDHLPCVSLCHAAGQDGRCH